MTTKIELGQTLPELKIKPVDRTVLALFAGASGDHMPLHIDIDVARKAGMPDVFAHGMLGMAWLGRLLTQWVPQSRLRKYDVRFSGITHLGHAMTCRGKVTELVDLDGEACAKLEVTSTNQYGEQKIVGEAIVALA